MTSSSSRSIARSSCSLQRWRTSMISTVWKAGSSTRRTREVSTSCTTPLCRTWRSWRSRFYWSAHVSSRGTALKRWDARRRQTYGPGPGQRWTVSQCSSTCGHVRLSFWRAKYRYRDRNVLVKHVSYPFNLPFFQSWSGSWFSSVLQLLNCYYEAYQHAAGTEERFELARVVTDIMHGRPQLDLNQDYFLQAYRAEIDCLRSHRQLIRDVLDNQVTTKWLQMILFMCECHILTQSCNNMIVCLIIRRLNWSHCPF